MKNKPVKNTQSIFKSVGYASISFGFDPRRAKNVLKTRKFFLQLKNFKKLGGIVSDLQPILSDYEDSAGSANGDYFHQDLLVASLIHSDNPVRHIDVGSRIDGFVAHVAVFRTIDVIDIRKLEKLWHPNISFVQMDMMNAEKVESNISDSVSCLHAIEHFGLGRYSDPLDPLGHVSGFQNLLRMVKPGGRLYISFPVGPVSLVHFNSHRIFHPHELFSWSDELQYSDLERFDLVDNTGSLQQNFDLFGRLDRFSGGCGIYTFRKPLARI